MQRPLATALTVAAILACRPVAGQDLPVDLELVLAVDVSGSIDADEAHQQRQGYLYALQDPTVLDAIRANALQRIAVAYVEWASADYQRLVVDWTLIEDEATARAFVGALGEVPPASARWTSISAAIDFSVPLFDRNGFEGERKVIDVSGDGPNNRGRPVQTARDQAVARGIVVNGLPILNDNPQPFSLPTPKEMALDRYYIENVIGGPGSFVIPAQDFADFKEAILAKLIREIAGDPDATRLASRR